MSRSSAWHRSRWPAMAIAIVSCALLIGTMFSGLSTVQARQSARTLEAAVAQAVTEATGTAPPAGVHVVEVQKQERWVFGTAALLGTGDDHAPPIVEFFLARQDGNRWSAAVNGSRDAARWLNDAPRGLLSADLRALFDAPGQMSAQASNAPVLSMPFPAGEGWFFGGPHGNGTAGPPTEHPWSALDFLADRDGRTSGRVLAADEGTVMLPCQAPGDNGPLVLIAHGHGWVTHYFHLDVAAVNVGQKVGRGAFLGNTSERVTGGSCFGTAVGRHVHFALANSDGFVELDGRKIGGWRIDEGDDAYQGCLYKAYPYPSDVVTPEQPCAPESQFYNDGSLGSGPKFGAPNKIRSGQRFGIGLIFQFPPKADIRLYFLHRQPDDDLERTAGKVVRINSDGIAQNIRLKAPSVRSATTAWLCAERMDSYHLGCRSTRIVVD